MQYTAVIRTLGTGGEKYQKLLDSLERQTIRPAYIYIYIAEGCVLPKETVGREQYVFVKRGMVAQRALPYVEVTTPWILFLDDDLFLPPDTVQMMFDEMLESQADVIVPDIYHNSQSSLKTRLRLSLLGLSKASRYNQGWAYKIMKTTGFSYKTHIQERYAFSQSNAGACFMCKKDVFLNIHFEDELWLDQAAYAFADDQVMFYKMYLSGIKQITSFDIDIKHLDVAASNPDNCERRLRTLSSEGRNRLIFWYRFIYKQEKSFFINLWNLVCIIYFFLIRIVCMLCIGHFIETKAFYRGLKDGCQLILSRKIQRYVPLENNRS